MTPRELAEILRGERETDDTEGAISAIARGARARRSAEELAERAFADDPYALEREPPSEPAFTDPYPQTLRLAASEPDPLDFPQRYSSGDWRVGLGLDPEGRAIAVLEQGAERVFLELEGRMITLARGTSVPLDELDSPPPLLRLRRVDGRALLLTPQR